MGYNYYFPLLWLVILGFFAGIYLVSNAIKNLENHLGKETDPAIRRRFENLLQLRWALAILAFTMAGSGGTFWYLQYSRKKLGIEQRRTQLLPKYDPTRLWVAPDPYLAQTDPKADLISYGRDLIAHTSDYFGKNGKLKSGATNGLNCQNCHLDAGTKPFGNNYFAVNSTYPQFRARSGSLETIPKRINDCFQRSLNGAPLDTTGKEMRAIVAYIEWLGTSIPKGEKPKGTGLVAVPFLNRAADPAKGKEVYSGKCAVCHGADGQGLPRADIAGNYPPLWGDQSYNQGAGLYRLSRLAGYVKANMPLGATHQFPQLTDEEAWDVAAFINTQPRPGHPFIDQDWPDVAKKPFDHPFGPFADTFSEAQHKLGPFGPLVASRK